MQKVNIRFEALKYYISTVNPFINPESKMSIKKLIFELWVLFPRFREYPLVYMMKQSEIDKLDQETKDKYFDMGVDYYLEERRDQFEIVARYDEWLKEGKAIDDYYYRKDLPKHRTVSRIRRVLQEYFLRDDNLEVNNNVEINNDIKVNKKELKELIYLSYLNSLFNNELISSDEYIKIKKKIGG